jgi:PleD family two-component response regulator
VSGRDPAETLARADRAMYDAKRAGRDTAVAASTPTGDLAI